MPRFKLATENNGEWAEHRHAARFVIDNAKEKLTASVPGTDAAPLLALTAVLKPPYYVLYILHTSRGEGDVGRYQSTELSRDELNAFLARFSDFISGDGRFDLWVYSPSEKNTVVWDRHNYVHAYGPVAKYASALEALGFIQAPLPTLGDHIHHYREAFDGDARDMLNWFDWVRTPLRPEDEQVV